MLLACLGFVLGYMACDLLVTHYKHNQIRREVGLNPKPLRNVIAVKQRR